MMKRDHMFDSISQFALAFDPFLRIVLGGFFLVNTIRALRKKEYLYAVGYIVLGIICIL